LIVVVRGALFADNFHTDLVSLGEFVFCDADLFVFVAAFVTGFPAVVCGTTFVGEALEAGLTLFTLGAWACLVYTGTLTFVFDFADTFLTGLALPCTVFIFGAGGVYTAEVDALLCGFAVIVAVALGNTGAIAAGLCVLAVAVEAAAFGADVVGCVAGLAARTVGVSKTLNALLFVFVTHCFAGFFAIFRGFTTTFRGVGAGLQEGADEQHIHTNKHREIHAYFSQ